MSKTVLLWDDARKKLFEGMKIVSTAVMSSMGPCGRNAVLGRFDRSPVVTNDGVTIAREISLQDPVENIWASIIKEAAEKTNKEVGDWTTTTTCLTYAIAKHGLSELQNGTNPFVLSKNLHEIGDSIVENIRKYTKTIKHTSPEVKDIATISAQDEEIWETIAKCIKEIWPDGQISVEISKEIGIKEELKKWYVIDAGLVSPIFMLDEENLQSDLSDVTILVGKWELSDAWGVLIWVLEEMHYEGRKNLLIMADEVSWGALDAIIKNNKSWMFNIIVTWLPSTWQNSEDILEDVYTVCCWWETILERGFSGQIWRAGRVVSWKDSTVIVDWYWEDDWINERISMLKKKNLKEKNEYRREKVEERISRLSSGVAIIYVGCQTEMEAVNKKYKIEDAICATKSAIKNWIVIGGGFALVRAATEVPVPDWFGVAWRILINAIKEPAKTIIYNAWRDAEKIIHPWDIKSELVFNSKTWVYTPWDEYKIIDPAKVVECAVQNAISAACMFLTTDVVVFETEDIISQ